MVKLVIVESPAKIKKISSYLGNDFKVMASFGHFRDLPKKSMGIDLENNYQAKYEITNHKVVSELKKSCSTASIVYLATDGDREGAGIAYHLMEVLKLSYPKAKRMVFNEITKTAIMAALAEADRNGKMNINEVNSYKARRFIDKIVGFKSSPLIWKNVTGGKSGGRVQSVAAKLIIDKEENIKKHVPEEKYNISGTFLTENKSKINASLKQIPKEHKEALEVLDLCKEAKFSISETNKVTVTHAPPPAFKTSVYQQEAGKRYSISPKDSMRIAQKLYEKGMITYHRTDVTRLSDQFKGDAKEYITAKYGKEYLSDEMKNYDPSNEEKSDSNKSKKGEQAAHEAIRPTNINTLTDQSLEPKEKLMYKMIWVRAVGSLMAKEKCHRYTAKITLSNSDKYWFTASYLLTIFLGFKILNDKKENEENNKILMDVKNGDSLEYDTIESNQSFTQPPKRFTESTLVKELENKGIGRPSTYATIISTIQTRKYTIKKKGEPIKKDCVIDTLKNGKVKSKTKKIDFGNKKQCLFPTELGIKVTEFLVENLEYMMDYKFTSTLENDLDEVSKGKKNWLDVVDNLTKTLQGLIDQVPEKERPSQEERKSTKDNRTVGKHEGSLIEFFTGQYGPFIKYKSKCYSLPKECLDISLVTLEIALAAIEKKKNGGVDTSNCLVSHDCEIDNKKGKIQGVRGRYGLYLRFVPDKGKMSNYFLPKNLKEDDDAVKLLTLEDCLKQVEFVSKYKKKK